MKDLDLEHIANIITTGVKCGYYPNWHLSFFSIETKDVSQSSLNHIAQQVSDGCVEGEVIEDERYSDKNGYWKFYYAA